MVGYRVRYTLAAKLVNELVEAADDRQLTKTINRCGRVDLDRRRRTASLWDDMPVLRGMLTSYQPLGETEAADLDRMRRLAAAPDPWSRATPFHFTASALVLHPESGRVLLRWHVKASAWLQVGGHGDEGESDPLAIAFREAREETGLSDLVAWPDAALRHLAVCRVPASRAEPEHEHADLRFFFGTREPDAIRPENPDSPLRWLTIGAARDLVGTGNLLPTLDRAERVLGTRD